MEPIPLYIQMTDELCIEIWDTNENRFDINGKASKGVMQG